MLNNNFISIDTSWAELSRKWNYNGPAYDIVEAFKDSLQNAKNAISVVTSLGDVGALSISVTDTQIDNLEKKRGKLLTFCDQIHYEAVEETDNPFSNKLSACVQDAFALMPSKITSDNSRYSTRTTSISLVDAMAVVATDYGLKKSFFDSVNKLEKEKPSKSLKDAIESAKWQKEFFETINIAKANYPNAAWGSGLINNQGDYSNLAGTYGSMGSIGGNACGAIAVHNALNILGMSKKFEGTQYLYDKYWPGTTVVGGLLGTNPLPIIGQFNSMGFDTKVYYGAKNVKNDHDAYIALYVWKEGSDLGAHYIAGEYKEGKLYVYNYDNPTVQYDSFVDFEIENNTNKADILGELLVLGIDKP